MLRQFDLDDERFAGLSERARMSAARLFPDWSDFNTHDPGVTLIDLLVWLTETQRFQLSESERADAFFPLLGIAPLGVRPARADITLPTGSPVRIPAGSPVTAEEIRFETEAEIPANPGTAVTLQVVQRHTVQTPFVLADAKGFPNLRLALETHGQKIYELTLAVTGRGSPEGRIWTRVDDFRLSGPADTHFALDGETVCFGDGIQGLAPEGAVTVASMSLTRGAEGNITSGLLTELRFGGHIITLTQEKPASGGAERESSAETLARMAAERRQAVTARDIETLTRETPGLDVEEVRAFAPEGRGERLVIVAVRLRGEALTERRRRAIRAHLEPYRLAGYDFAVRPLGARIPGAGGDTA
ncbi:MAG: baseplate J/gp47 family protein [Oscillospiraceae bacterium]|jgi:hypothetical protein|nr:baseplate J/gp47 family protein [Oscillospiraceae bacterium]